MGGREDYSENGGNRTRSEIFQTSKKKVVKNLCGNRQKKPGGAANLGSARVADILSTPLVARVFDTRSGP